MLSFRPDESFVLIFWGIGVNVSFCILLLDTQV